MPKRSGGRETRPACVRTGERGAAAGARKVQGPEQLAREQEAPEIQQVNAGAFVREWLEEKVAVGLAAGEIPRHQGQEEPDPADQRREDWPWGRRKRESGLESVDGHDPRLPKTVHGKGFGPGRKNLEKPFVRTRQRRLDCIDPDEDVGSVQQGSREVSSWRTMINHRHLL